MLLSACYCIAAFTVPWIYNRIIKKFFNVACCVLATLACVSAEAEIVQPFSAIAGYQSTTPDWQTNTADDIDGERLGHRRIYFLR